MINRRKFLKIGIGGFAVTLVACTKQEILLEPYGMDALKEHILHGGRIIVVDSRRPFTPQSRRQEILSKREHNNVFSTYTYIANDNFHQRLQSRKTKKTNLTAVGTIIDARKMKPQSNFVSRRTIKDIGNGMLLLMYDAPVCSTIMLYERPEKKLQVRTIEYSDFLKGAFRLKQLNFS